MKLLTALPILILVAGCSSPKTDDQKTNPENTVSAETNSGIPPEEQTSEAEPSVPQVFQVSTYDDPETADRVAEHKASLKKLNDKGIFSNIHAKVLQKISAKHRDYFESNQEYVLLAFAKGSLFPENKSDYSFAAYHKNDQRIYILVYRESKRTYSKLYSELKVENGLKDAGCRYGAFGTLDFQLADELLYQEEYQEKSADEFVAAGPLKIADLSKDDTFYLSDGCFSKKVSKKDTSNSLCISTSSVYNNWEALKYLPATNSFIIYYGQAFAD